MGCHFLFQVLFATQGLNLHWQADSLPLCHLGAKVKLVTFFYSQKVSIRLEISVTESLCCTEVTNTTSQDCDSTILQKKEDMKYLFLENLVEFTS